MKLPERLRRKIDIQLLEDAEEGFRRHLGASVIGRDCPRALLYLFRWCKRPDWKEILDVVDRDEPQNEREEQLIEKYGALMRLFDRGHLEENRFVKLLRSVGIEVLDADPNDGGQFRVSGVFGHFGGSMDGKIMSAPPELELPIGVGVTEFKTHSLKSFEKLKKEGVRQSKPEHFIQMQTYMQKDGHQWALYIAVCKNDDRLHYELIELEECVGIEAEARAERIIFANDAPLRISSSPAFFGCSWCDYKGICHGFDVPEVNCRTCAHSTPVEDGKWRCDIAGGKGIIPRNVEPVGCGKHVFHPMLLNAEYLEGDGNNAKYRLADRSEILQGPDGIKSKDLCSLASTR